MWQSGRQLELRDAPDLVSAHPSRRHHDALELGAQDGRSGRVRQRSWQKFERVAARRAPPSLCPPQGAPATEGVVGAPPPASLRHGTGRFAGQTSYRISYLPHWI
jgi:hypothetical protein